jgi:hypothetical protein
MPAAGDEGFERSEPDLPLFGVGIPGDQPGSASSRAERREVVGFLTDDEEWRSRPGSSEGETWRRCSPRWWSCGSSCQPNGTFTDADLAARISTYFADRYGFTPAVYASRYGVNITAVVARVWEPPAGAPAEAVAAAVHVWAQAPTRASPETLDRSRTVLLVLETTCVMREPDAQVEPRERLGDPSRTRRRTRRAGLARREEVAAVSPARGSPRPPGADPPLLTPPGNPRAGPAILLHLRTRHLRTRRRTPTLTAIQAGSMMAERCQKASNGEAIMPR